MSNPRKSDYSAAKWDLADLRALFHLSLPGDPYTTSRTKMVKELVEGGIKPTSQTDHALAAMRKAMEKARGTRNVAPENGKPSSDEDGETRATPKRRRLEVEQVLTAPPRYEESLELTALKERLHALENKQDDHGQARRPDESTGSFDQPNAYVLSNRQTLIEEFAMNNHLVKATVAKIAGGYYCEIYECVKFSSVRSQASLSTSERSSSGPGTTTLVAATKKVVIPQCFRDFSGPITVLMKARKLFSVVGHESDSEYVDFYSRHRVPRAAPPGCVCSGSTGATDSFAKEPCMVADSGQLGAMCFPLGLSPYKASCILQLMRRSFPPCPAVPAV